VVWWLPWWPLDPRFAGLTPTEVDGFLKAIKIRSTPFFGEEVKPSAPWRRFYGMLNNPLKYEWDTSQGKIHHFFRQFLLRCYLVTAGRIARYLWQTNQFSPVDIITPWFSMLIYYLVVAAVQRCSLTPSTRSLSTSSSCPTNNDAHHINDCAFITVIKNGSTFKYLSTDCTQWKWQKTQFPVQH
jgi:hypothetical protein